jgi:DNA-binding transcriptional MerR regulator
MKNAYYRTGEFARKASVSERTLRYYDRLGLLSPTAYSQAGYRLYSDRDFPRLQQILALKYLGFSLEEIRRCLDGNPRRFKQALAVQKAMLLERKMHLEAILAAIERTDALLDGPVQDWEPIIKIFEVMQMNDKPEWIKKYFSDEQADKMEELSQSSYTDADRQKLAEWGQGWSEEDQQEASRRWDELYQEAKSLADAGKDPAGEQAQALAARWMALVNEFTRGDAAITAGLQKFWQGMAELPEAQRPLPKVLNDHQQAFVDQALALYNNRQAGLTNEPK